MNLPYRPALDGVRAVAVVAVLAYHGGLTVAPGGFLGVDVFFVLSGYLITALLVLEWRTHRHIDLRRFWSRRARRLLPALSIVVVAVVVQALIAAPETVAELRGDALGTLGYVANWRLVTADHSYFDLLAEPSPLRHAWSLAIEEQWYLFWPLILGGVLAMTRRRPRAALATTLGAAAFSALLMAWWFDPTHDPSRVYYGTDTRAQGLLIGAALALFMHSRSPATAPRHRARHAGVVHGRVGRVALEAAGVVGLVVVLWMVSSVSEADPRLYRGGFLVAAVASVALIAAVAREGSPLLGRVLSLRPLTALGRISYGVYLWHWPLFLWLGPANVGLTGWPLFGVRSAATVAVATVSYRLVEQPLRRGEFPFGQPLKRPLTMVTAVAGAAVVIAVVLPLAAVRTPEADADKIAVAPLDTAQTLGADVAPTRVLVAGDSVAQTLAKYFRPDWVDTGLAVDYRGTYLGCGIVTGQPFNGGRPTLWSDPACSGWETRWLDGVDTYRPDVVLILLGAWEVLDHRVDGKLLEVGSRGYREYLHEQLRRGVDLASGRDARVVLLTTPCFRAGTTAPMQAVSDRNDDDRVEWFNGIVREIAGTDPRVRVIDLHAWVCPGGEDQPDRDGTRVRSDGMHFTPDGSVLAWRWLAPQLLDRPVSTGQLGPSAAASAP